MEQTAAIATAQIVLGFLIWLVFFLIIRWSVNKKFVSEKRIQPKTKDFANEFYKELQIFYHIEESGNKLILRTEKIADLITNGIIIVEARNKDDPSSISINYKRKIKFLGYIIILLGIACCYVGALVPIIIISETKKNALAEIDRIFSIAKSI
ncbi:MAG: hypothetical protein IT234_06275 [Bacteroidia bacterium]|nr:hypothetical protein [Bacteroidia bacterium]